MKTTLGQAFKYVTVEELILCVIFLVIGHFLSNNYIRGVGVGLLISGATSAIAILVLTREDKTK